MTRPLAVLRPAPGNAATVARIAALGRTAIALPLFATVALDWDIPDSAQFDALFFTSANAVRLAGAGLSALTTLPVYAVGAATAAAATAAGLHVAHVGDRDGTALRAAADAAGVRRALLLCGRDRTLDSGGIVARAIGVYAADPLPIPANDIARLAGSVALIHSPRAAARLAALIEDRTAIRIAAISRAAADAAGPGWDTIAVAPRPDDDALIAVAAALAD